MLIPTYGLKKLWLFARIPLYFFRTKRFCYWQNPYVKIIKNILKENEGYVHRQNQTRIR